MQADLTRIELLLRIISGVLFVIGVFLAWLSWRWAPLLRGRRVRWFFGLLLVLFNVPLLMMAGFGHHILAAFPEVLVKALLYPALAWHLTNVLALLLLLATSPIWLLLGTIKWVRWLVRGGRGSEAVQRGTSRRAFLRNASLAVPALTVGGLMSCIVRAESEVSTVQVDIGLPRLPRALDGLRIVHVSDLHAGSFIRLRQVDELVERINALDPDLFVFTGDLCDIPELLEPCLERFSSIRAAQRFAVLGNHEYFFPIDDVKRAYASSTIHLLVDEHRTFELAGRSVTVAGVDYAFHRDIYGLPLTTQEEHTDRALAGVPDDTLLLGLAHNPRAFEALRLGGAQLVLAGHTHGGQVVPFERSPVRRRFPHFRGLYQEQGGSLYVTAGAGHWLPLRVNCPREISLLHLRA